MSESLEIWVCTGPRCQSAGGTEAKARARRIGGQCGLRIFERNCFARCELSERPLPAVRVGREWIHPPTAESLRAAIAAGQECDVT